MINAFRYKLSGFFILTLIASQLSARCNILYSPFFTDNKPNVNFILDTIKILGNKKTKEYTITKEIVLEQGDTTNNLSIDDQIELSRNNLLNTSLFLTVTIERIDLKAVADTSSKLNIHYNLQVNVTERWYIFPNPHFNIADRNLNVWWTEHNHSLSRVDYGIDIGWNNITGNADKLNLRVHGGYNQKLELLYNRPYIFRFSNIGGGFYVGYFRNRQIAYTTFENKQLFVEDTIYARTRFRTGIYLTKRNNIFYTHTVELKYLNVHITDTVVVLNPEYFLSSNNNQQFLSLSYEFTDNHVDNRSYPLKGYFAEITLIKTGLGVLSDVNQFTISPQFNKYLQLSNRLFLQGQIAAKYIIGEQYPYHNLESLGYCENFVRGYEYYVIDGQQTYLLRSNFKIKLIDRMINAPLIDWKQFDNIPVRAFFKIFADAGYVVDNFYNENNFLTNSLLYSAGAGIDITSYYDWVFRAEAAINALGEFGIYLHIGLDLSTYADCSLW